MAVQLRERTQRTGEHSHKDIYLISTYAGMHVCNQARIKQCRYTIRQGNTRMQLCKANTHGRRTTTVLHNHLAVYYLQDTAPHHSFKGKTAGKARGRLDLAGLYKSRSCGDRKGSERPGWLPATFVVTRWGDPRRSFDTAVGAA